jgi:RNA polymerase sigma factor (sigma-70 family)
VVDPSSRSIVARIGAWHRIVQERVIDQASADGTDEMDERLWKAIAELHENASEIFILRYVHNYSLADISRLLGTTRGTVAVSLYRSRARLTGKRSARPFRPSAVRQ